MEKIEKILDASVRPRLLLHGGGIVGLSFEDGVYRFRMTGQCANCPSAYFETRDMVYQVLTQALPEVQDVELVQQVSDDLLRQARAILSHQMPERHG